MEKYRAIFKSCHYKLIIAFFCCSIFFIGGCASVQVKEMTFIKGGEQVSFDKGSVCLLSLKTDNRFKPEWPPEVYSIEIIDNKSNKKTNIAVRSMSFGSLLKKSASDAFAVKKASSSWEGLISFQLEPGSYQLSAIRGGCVRGIGVAVAMATFDFPFDLPFQIYDKEYVYLGRIEMTNRERISEDDIPSGSNLITQIPQRQSGFGTGTFDVTVYDNYDQDIQSFKEKYHAIDDNKINKRILPQWKKPDNY